MILRGPIYIRLRERMLGLYPSDLRLSKEHAFSFSEWLARGSFTVTGITASEITIQTSANEIAAVFLRDAEALTNSCLEHVLEIAHLTSDLRARSDGWSVVTNYYYAFFRRRGFCGSSGTL